MQLRKCLAAVVTIGALSIGGTAIASAAEPPADAPTTETVRAHRCERALEHLEHMKQRLAKGQELLARLQAAHDEAVAAGDEAKARLSEKIVKLEAALARLRDRIAKVEARIAEHCDPPAV